MAQHQENYSSALLVLGHNVCCFTSLIRNEYPGTDATTKFGLVMLPGFGFCFCRLNTLAEYPGTDATTKFGLVMLPGFGFFFCRLLKGISPYGHVITRSMSLVLSVEFCFGPAH
uniref:Uncharacterized protein n=1 Tax=Populus trichocarpa TaxID=3694 RepID=U5G812_POPTR